MTKILEETILKVIEQKNWDLIREENLIQPGEVVLGAVHGVAISKEQSEKCKLILTSTKLLAFMPKMFGRYAYEEYPLSEITSLKKHIGMLTAEISFTMAGNREKIGYIKQDVVNIMFNKIQMEIKHAKKEGVSSLYCGDCGASLRAGVKFCSHCGSPVNK